MLGEAAASQLGVLTPPQYEIPDRLRPQEVRDLGTTEFEGATCTLYGAADTTSTGNRIDFTFAIDAEDRLCFVQTESVGISSLLVVTELDESAKITPPENARRLIATPVASPASVATPWVRHRARPTRRWWAIHDSYVTASDHPAASAYDCRRRYVTA
jgi:hypothetical protein